MGGEEYPADLQTYFDQDGKWAVLALIARAAVALVANAMLMSGRTISVTHVLILGQMVVALLFLLAKTRRLKALATVLYGLILSLTMTSATPFAR